MPGCDSALNLFGVFALSPVESAAGNCQGSDQLEERKALSVSSILPAPPGQGGFRRSLGDWFGWLVFSYQLVNVSLLSSCSTLWG